MNLNSLIDEKVHYLPVGLTSLQKELVKILVKLHGDSLLRQLNADNAEDQSARDLELNKLLIKNLKLANNHPFLMVEHYIPKKLLLMESNERLMLQSDKFNKFDKIVQHMQNSGLRLCVVGSNVKELDLIEAFLEERDLVCSRSIQPVDTDAKILKISLISSAKLQSLNNVQGNFDLVLSFDEELNELNGNVEVFRKYNNTPLIKLMLVNSFHHGALNNYTGRELLLSCLKPISYQETKIDVGSILNEFIKTGKWGIVLPTFSEVDKEEATKLIEDVDLEFLAGTKSLLSETDVTANKKIKLETPKDELLTPSNYQNLLTRLTISRIEAIKSKISSRNEKLQQLRVQATVRNNTNDETKLKISNLFRQTRELKETTLVNVEKLFEKLTFESDRNKDTIKELTNDTSDEETEEVLRARLEALKAENSTIESSLNDLRLSYQKHTTEAGELSSTLKSLQRRNSQLEKLLLDNGRRLRSLKNQTIKAENEEEVAKLQLELDFLTAYQCKLDTLIKEKGSMLNIGRNGRIHRSTTPYN